MEDVLRIRFRPYEEATSIEDYLADLLIKYHASYHEPDSKYGSMFSRQYLFAHTSLPDYLLVVPSKCFDCSIFYIVRHADSDNPEIIGSNRVKNLSFYLHRNTMYRGARMISTVVDGEWLGYVFNGKEYCASTPSIVNESFNQSLSAEQAVPNPWNADYPAEIFAQPEFELTGLDPSPGGLSDQALLVPGKTLEGAAKMFSEKCSGGDEYTNNCAHFLSNAFIKAGFTELRDIRTNKCIKARCGTSASRPIRARNMWCWFQAKARRHERMVEPNTGFWAVFQHIEGGYWGGHVVIIDTNRWKYYGTGWYSEWDQYAFQW
ncbi:hypothetical protein M446_1468 [Methylobacterium sp. 4-46]|uniref:hypothetical protein n=1 Tax=unclassified Methylobacterium TaxID=2615210 RepID=UPI000165C7D4|nr:MULTISPECIES: hypothetical protein [Methylobacterium]ACA15974.1 hypothetical protein M446_1468 [Methylobacterium sp. 4-46]WFT81693.1 hypothetical protein QA634_07455 [Methylobacterium nodulans]